QAVTAIDALTRDDSERFQIRFHPREMALRVGTAWSQSTAAPGNAATVPRAVSTRRDAETPRRRRRLRRWGVRGAIWSSPGSRNASGPGSRWSIDAQIAALDAGGAGLEDKDRPLLVLPHHLAASPVVLTEAEFD
ncbi:MAG: hypothetical protein ACK5TO_06360, partial [Planctomycetaceae bacterium]